MRIERIIALSALALLLCFQAVAQTKVGYVDVDRVTRKAKAVNQAMESVQSDIEDLQKQIDDKRQQIRDLEAEVQRSEGVVAASEIEKKRKELKKLRDELEDLAYRAERKARELDATVFEPLMKRILFEIQDVAKEKKYDIILRGEAVLYGTTGADITDDVIRKLNEERSTTPSLSRDDSESKSAKDAPASEASSPKSTSEAGKSSEKAKTTKESPVESKRGTPARPSRPVDRQPD